MTFAVVVDVIVVALVLYRQRMVRRVRPRLSLRLPTFLAVVGLVELVSYTGSHRVPAETVGVLALSFAVGAVVLGAVRAATVKLWRVENVTLRQGTTLTILLWLLSIGLHYGAQAWINALDGPSAIVSASLLLWLGITYGVQTAVVHRRAGGLLAAGGAIDARADVVEGPRRAWSAGAEGRPPRRAPVDAIDAHAEPISPAVSDDRGSGPGGPGGDHPPAAP